MDCNGSMGIKGIAEGEFQSQNKNRPCHRKQFQLPPLSQYYGRVAYGDFCSHNHRPVVKETHFQLFHCKLEIFFSHFKIMVPERPGFASRGSITVVSLSV
jgi:hypothetical protein